MLLLYHYLLLMRRGWLRLKRANRNAKCQLRGYNGFLKCFQATNKALIVLHWCACTSLQVSPVHPDIVIFSSSVYTDTCSE
jgi:hypothetical protein